MPSLYQDPSDVALQLEKRKRQRRPFQLRLERQASLASSAGSKPSGKAPLSKFIISFPLIYDIL
jgi:hypothetical protein